MKSLKEMKQNGRVLRQHLATVFGTPVSLSQAYEAVAIAEGFASWNVLSAKLVGSTGEALAPGVTANAPADSQRVFAIFDTGDGKAKRYFDATAWFEQASYEQIVDLMEEVPSSRPREFSSAYGGGERGSAVADFFAGRDEGVDEVFFHIEALAALGQHCCGSYCCISGPQLDAWVGPLFGVRGQRIQEVKHNRAYGRMVLGLNDGTAAPAPTVAAEVDAASEAEVKYSAKGLFGLMQIIEVNLVDVLNEYELPDETPEWKWVEENHRWAHKGNNAEPGVWEFMVYVDEHDTTFMDDIPAVLKPFFEEALKLKAPWILFHQG